ncbi:hypothetical protein VTI28DRAFT_7016 [Corynascus sepedonium]
MVHYYKPEPEPQYYTRPPPRAYYAPRGTRGAIVQVEGPRPVSPSPTRVLVIEKRRQREEPQGLFPWLCASFCCFWVCCDCADSCWCCCPEVDYYDSD